MRSHHPPRHPPHHPMASDSPSMPRTDRADAAKPCLRIRARSSTHTPQAWDRFLDLLQARHRLIQDNENPEFAIVKRNTFPLAYFLCTRLWFSPAESACGDSVEFVDALIGYERHPHPHHLYLTEWMLLQDWQNLHQPTHDWRALVQAKSRFCAMINTYDWQQRGVFYEYLSRYRRLDSLGDLMRNAPRPSGLAARYTKWDLTTLPAVYRRYKFVLAFENASYPGYTSEKIFCALLGRAVPIYWGDPTITNIINPACFINAHDFATPQALAAHVMNVDADDALYRAYLEAPVFRQHPIVEEAHPEILKQKLADLLTSLRQQRHQPQGVKSMFQRECLSRFHAKTTRRLVPHPRYGFEHPQDWSAPRRFGAPPKMR